MIQKNLLLLHGFASSANSTKAQFLSGKTRHISHTSFHAIDFNPTPKDFEHMTITGMVNRVRQFVLDNKLQQLSLIGSSMGALVAQHYARRYGGILRLLLLAPALSYSTAFSDQEVQQWKDKGVIKIHHFAFEREVPLRYNFHVDGQLYAQPIAPPVPVMIIHGRHDDVVPIEASYDHAANYPDMVKLIEVNSDHRLNGQLEFIWTKGVSFFKEHDLNAAV